MEEGGGPASCARSSATSSAVAAAVAALDCLDALVLAAAAAARLRSRSAAAAAAAAADAADALAVFAAALAMATCASTQGHANTARRVCCFNSVSGLVSKLWYRSPFGQSEPS